MDLFVATKVDRTEQDVVQEKTVSTREPYRSHITKIYIDGVLHGKLPLVTTDPRYLEKQAKEYMDKLACGFVSGGAGELSTMDANRLAFRQWKLIPRFLRPCTPRDLRTELFGVTYGKFITHDMLYYKILISSNRLALVNGTCRCTRSVSSPR